VAEVYVPVKMKEFNRWIHELAQIQLIMFAMGHTVDKCCECPGVQEVNEVAKSKAEQFRSILVDMRLSFGEVSDEENNNKG